MKVQPARWLEDRLWCEGRTCAGGSIPVRQCAPGAPSAQRQGQCLPTVLAFSCCRGVLRAGPASHWGWPPARPRIHWNVISSFPYGSARHLSKKSSSWPAFRPPCPPVPPTVSIFGWDRSPGGSHWLPRWKEAQQLGFQCRWALQRGAGPPSCLCRGCGRVCYGWRLAPFEKPSIPSNR